MLDALARLPGVDVARGLAMVRGRSGKYLKLVRQVVLGHEDAMTRIDAALAAGDRVAVRQVSHSLKGAAATVGLDAISEAARQFDDLLRGEQVPLQGPQVDEARAVLRSVLERHVTDISRILAG